MKWLDELKRAAAEVPERYLRFILPIQPGEQVVGRLPKDLTLLAGLHRQRKEQLLERQSEHVAAHEEGKLFSEEDCKKFYEESVREAHELQAIETIFWIAVEVEFDVRGQKLGIRTGGNIVIPDDEVETIEVVIIDGHEMMIPLVMALVEG